MKTRLTSLLLAGLFLPAAAGAMCICFPCPDCDLQSAGQLNFVVMDREDGLLHLIPNIRIVGSAGDFALVIPTPGVPEISTMEATIWDEALDLTKPVFLQRTSDGGMGCGAQSSARFLASPPGSDAEGEDDGVTVIAEQTVGAFHVVTLGAPDPNELVNWLRDNGYDLSGLTAELIAPLVERGWVFTAMKLLEGFAPPDRWDANVDPVLITFEAENLEVPLSFLSINRAPSLPMAFFIVDDHRTTLPGFDETYANAISRSEHAAIAERYPTLGTLIRPGTFLTRLDRTFGPDDAMTESIQLARAPNDEEFRRTLNAALNSFPGALLLLSGLLLGFERIRRRAARN